MNHLNCDGHKLRIVGIDDEARVEFEIVCPGDCHLWAQDDGTWTNADFEIAAKHEANEPCWLRYWFNEDAMYGLECFRGRAEGVGPYEIGWRWDGEAVEFFIGSALANLMPGAAESPRKAHG